LGMVAFFIHQLVARGEQEPHSTYFTHKSTVKIQ